MPQKTSSSPWRASRGQTDSESQRSSGNPSPALRTRVIGEWPWQFTSPGMSSPPSSRDLGVGTGRGRARIAHPGDQVVVELHRARAPHVLVVVDREDGVGDQPGGHAVTQADEEAVGQVRGQTEGLVPSLDLHLEVVLPVAPADHGDDPGDEPTLAQQGQRPQVELHLFADPHQADPLARADLGQRTGAHGRRQPSRSPGWGSRADRWPGRRAAPPGGPRRRRRSRAPSGPPRGAPCATPAR